MRKFIFFLILIIVILILFAGFFWLYETKFMIGRASVSKASFSIDNSYLFVSPLRARANDKEKIRVTVFVLNNQGLGVMGKNVSLNKSSGLTIENIQSITDGFGKAVFDVKASVGGEYFLNVNIDGSPLKQQAKMSFY